MPCALRPLSLACLWALASLAHAQTTDDSPASLGTVVVTASGNPVDIRDAPGSISVITEAELRVRPAHELAELLTGVEGVTLNRSANGTPTIQMRGFDQAYTLILIDGKRVNASTSMFRGARPMTAAGCHWTTSSAWKWCAAPCPRCTAPMPSAV